MDPTQKDFIGSFHQNESHFQRKEGKEKAKMEFFPPYINKGGEADSINKVSQMFPAGTVHLSSFRDWSKGGVFRGPITTADIRIMEASSKSIRLELASFIITALNENHMTKENLFSGNNINISGGSENFRKHLGKVEVGEREADRRRFIVHHDHPAARQEMFNLDGEELEVVVRDDVIDRAVDAIEAYQFIKATLALAKVEKLTEKKDGGHTVRFVPTHKSTAKNSRNREDKKVVKRKSGTTHAATIEGLRKEERKTAMHEQEKDDQKDAIIKDVVREGHKKSDKRS